MMRIEVAEGTIAEITVYCTGDWDQARQAEHAAAVTLIRPTPPTTLTCGLFFFFFFFFFKKKKKKKNCPNGPSAAMLST